jgi:hypothetical protein
MFFNHAEDYKCLYRNSFSIPSVPFRDIYGAVLDADVPACRRLSAAEFEYGHPTTAQVIVRMIVTTPVEVFFHSMASGVTPRSTLER